MCGKISKAQDYLETAPAPAEKGTIVPTLAPEETPPPTETPITQPESSPPLPVSAPQEPPPDENLKKKKIAEAIAQAIEKLSLTTVERIYSFVTSLNG